MRVTTAGYTYQYLVLPDLTVILVGEILFHYTNLPFLIKNEVEGISIFVSHIHIFHYYKMSLYIYCSFSLLSCFPLVDL